MGFQALKKLVSKHRFAEQDNVNSSNAPSGVARNL